MLGYNREQTLKDIERLEELLLEEQTYASISNRHCKIIAWQTNHFVSAIENNSKLLSVREAEEIGTVGQYTVWRIPNSGLRAVMQRSKWSDLCSQDHEAIAIAEFIWDTAEGEYWKNRWHGRESANHPVLRRFSSSSA